MRLKKVEPWHLVADQRFIELNNSRIAVRQLRLVLRRLAEQLEYVQVTGTTELLAEAREVLKETSPAKLRGAR